MVYNVFQNEIINFDNFHLMSFLWDIAIFLKMRVINPIIPKNRKTLPDSSSDTCFSSVVRPDSWSPDTSGGSRRHGFSHFGIYLRLFKVVMGMMTQKNDNKRSWRVFKILGYISFDQKYQKQSIFRIFYRKSGKDILFEIFYIEINLEGCKNEF